MIVISIVAEKSHTDQPKNFFKPQENGIHTLKYEHKVFA